MSQFNFNMDASESAFVSKQLEVIRSQTYDIKYPELKARDFIPVDNSVSPGAESVTYRQYDQRGLAKIVTNYSDDFPRAEVTAKEFTTRVKSLGSSYAYNMQEIRASQMAGTDLAQRKANAARKAIEEKIESIAKNGDDDHGLLGLLNQSNTTSYTVATGAAGSKEWANKTSKEILADINSMFNTIHASTKGVERADTLLLPLEQYGLIASKPMGDGLDGTVLDFLLRTSPWVKLVQPWYGLEGAGSNSTDRMVAYRKDADALQLLMPQEFEQFAPQQKAMEVVTYCHARTGGVVVYYPLSMAYGDGI